MGLKLGEVCSEEQTCAFFSTTFKWNVFSLQIKRLHYFCYLQRRSFQNKSQTGKNCHSTMCLSSSSLNLFCCIFLRCIFLRCIFLRCIFLRCISQSQTRAVCGSYLPVAYFTVFQNGAYCLLACDLGQQERLRRLRKKLNILFLYSSRSTRKNFDNLVIVQLFKQLPK